MRKYLPTISELIDRLSIVQLKEVFIPEHKEEYAKEIKDIVHDLDELGLDGKMIRAIIVLAQMNLHIWHNETKYRAGEGDGNLGLTHGLNGIRNTAKNIIQDQLRDDGRKDYKVDCIAEEFDDWEVSWQMGYKIWPIGKVPKKFQRPELDQVREYGYDWKDPWDVVEMFEQEVAKFAGCKYGIAIDNSTNGLFLCLKYMWKQYHGMRMFPEEVTIPSRTYCSVPMILFPHIL